MQWRGQDAGQAQRHSVLSAVLFKCVLWIKSASSAVLHEHSRSLEFAVTCRNSQVRCLDWLLWLSIHASTTCMMVIPVQFLSLNNTQLTFCCCIPLVKWSINTTIKEHPRLHHTCRTLAPQKITSSSCIVHNAVCSDSSCPRLPTHLGCQKT